MAQTLKVRKGDTVQVMKGKDRGKQGRVIEADPKHGRVLVENINMIAGTSARARSRTRAAWAAPRSSRAAASSRRRRCRSRT